MLHFSICVGLILAVKLTYAADSLKPNGDELQRVPAEWFTFSNIDWLLEWRQKHLPIISKKNEVVVTMIVRFGDELEEKIESIAVSEVRAEEKNSLNAAGVLVGYRITHILTGSKGTKFREKTVNINVVRKVISSVWELIYAAKIDSQAINMALGTNEIWYCIGAKIDADGWMTSTKQFGQAYNPSKDGVLRQLRNELLNHMLKTDTPGKAGGG